MLNGGSKMCFGSGMKVSGLRRPVLEFVGAFGKADVLGLHVEVERIVAAVAADAGSLQAAERRRQVAHVVGVEPDHAGFEFVGDAQRAAEVVGPDVAGEAVAHRIGDGERVGFVLERDHGEHRPEDLVLRDPHAAVDIGDQRRLDVVAAAGAVMPRRRRPGSRAFLPRDIEIRRDLGDMAFVDQRADLGRRIERVADLDLLHALGDPRGKFVGDRFLHQQAARRRAALAVERVDHEHDGIERAVEVGVVEHDDRVLAAEFEMHALQRRRALRMIAEPVALSPTKPMALMSGCSVSALPASSPRPCTVLTTPSGTPASSISRTSRSAVTGDHSAGLWTTVQPAASAGAIFQVESMNGVFHGVMMPTGPIGDAHGDVPVFRRGQVQPVAGEVHAVGKEAEILGGAHRGLRHEADRLAGVVAFEHRDLVGMRLDGVGDLVQDGLALAGIELAPGLERGLGRLRGRVDVGGVAARDRGDHRVVDRRRGLEGLAGRAAGFPAMECDAVAQRQRVSAAPDLRPVRCFDFELGRGCHGDLPDFLLSS